MGVYALALFYSVAILYLARSIGQRLWLPQGAQVGPSDHSLGKTVFSAVLASTPVVVLLGFRESVGTDYKSYVDIFHLYQDGVGVFYLEPGFWAINIIADWLVGEPWAMFLLAGALSVIPLFWVMARHSPAAWLSVVILFGLGFVYFQTNAIRSAIAIGILCVFFSAIWQAQPWRWVLGVGLSILFHYTAAVALAGYWVFRLQWPVYLSVVLLVVSAALAIVPEFGSLLGEMLASLVPGHYESYRLFLLEAGFRGPTFGLVLYFIKAAIIVASYERMAKMGVKVLVVQNISLFALLVFFALYQFQYIGRLAWFFLPALGLYWVFWLRLFKPGVERTSMAVIICMGYLFLFVRGGLTQRHDATPYMSLLF